MTGPKRSVKTRVHITYKTDPKTGERRPFYKGKPVVDATEDLVFTVTPDDIRVAKRVKRNPMEIALERHLLETGQAPR